jgi:hypothetical protein
LVLISFDRLISVLSFYNEIAGLWWPANAIGFKEKSAGFHLSALNDLETACLFQKAGTTIGFNHQAS